MTPSIRFLVSILLPALLIVGCESRPETLVPLERGNWWTYRSTDVTSPTAPQDSTSIMMRVNGERTVDGRVVSQIGMYESGDTTKPPLFGMLWANNESGFIRMASDSGFHPLDEIFPYPPPEALPPVDSAVKNESEPQIYRAMDEDTIVTVPAGTYHCILYRRVESGAVSEYFFAPGIGMVQNYLTMEVAPSVKRIRRVDLIATNVGME